MDPVGSLVWRYVTPERPRWQREALAFVRDRNPRLPIPYLPMKAAEVLRVLDKYRPRSIVEFGSGHSTAWFAAYAAETGATVTSFEHNPEWIERTKALVGDIGPVDLRLAETRRSTYFGRKAISYDAEIPPAEMIYVDGPSAEKDVADIDALNLAKSGPTKLILIDGRNATVEFMLDNLDVSERTNPFIPQDWRFSPSVNYAFLRRWWREALKRRAHSFFVRDNDR